MADIKWSAFPSIGALATGDTLVGLRAGANVRFSTLTIPWTLANGGTNAALTASNGGIFYSTATAGAILSGTATAGQMLQSGSTAAPAWSTSTYPATNAVNTLLYASSANVMAALATANNGMLVTSAGGVPSIGNTVGASISVTGTVTGTVGISTGVSGTSSGTNTFLTNNASGSSAAQVYQIAKSIAANSPITFLQITVPAGIYFIAIECFISVSRAALVATVGTSFVEKKYFAIARNGSGTDVVLDGSAGSDFIATTTTAGGAFSATSGATTIARNGAEANTSPQVVNITIDPNCGGASGCSLIFSTINVLGSATGLVIA